MFASLTDQLDSLSGEDKKFMAWGLYSEYLLSNVNNHQGYVMPDYFPEDYIEDQKGTWYKSPDGTYCARGVYTSNDLPRYSPKESYEYYLARKCMKEVREFEKFIQSEENKNQD